jgi:hypothetical protein
MGYLSNATVRVWNRATGRSKADLANLVETGSAGTIIGGCVVADYHPYAFVVPVVLTSGSVVLNKCSEKWKDSVASNSDISLYSAYDNYRFVNWIKGAGGLLLGVLGIAFSLSADLTEPERIGTAIGSAGMFGYFISSYIMRAKDTLKEIHRNALRRSIRKR